LELPVELGFNVASSGVDLYPEWATIMKNPFPGMNPYLEAHWRDVHASLIIYIRNQLQRKLPAGLVARAEEGVAIDELGRTLTYWPDVQVKESSKRPKDTNALHEPSAGWSQEADVMEPVLIVTEPETERWVEIREADGRVITLIEVLSVANKSAAGLGPYREKRSRFLAGGANFVEIDLLREGRDALGLPWNSLPASDETRYFACVRRPSRANQAELYILPLRRRLPGIRIPLRATDPEVVLHLQPLVDQCFEDGAYATLDFSRCPEPPLPKEDAEWFDHCLKRAGLRK
jgi:hypothetical protein